MTRLRAFYADWRVARYLSRRGDMAAGQWLVLRNDGTLWTCSQDQLQGIVDQLLHHGQAGAAMVRVRTWRGLMIASARVTWTPAAVVDFRLFWRASLFLLRPMEAVKTPAHFRTPVECAGNPDRAVPAGTHGAARSAPLTKPPR